MPLIVSHPPRSDAASLRPEPIAAPPYAAGLDGALQVGPLRGDAIVLGRFQRARSAIDLDVAARRGLALARRSVGGPALRLGEGALQLALTLASPGALGGVPDVARALNRHVRPILRALESLGAPATFGGRDFILVEGAPVAWIGVAHHAATGATRVEAYFALERPFALESALDLAHGGAAPRFRGRAPKALSDVLPKADLHALAPALSEAFAAQAGAPHVALAGPSGPLDEPPPPLADEPPFTAMVEESIGLLGARWEPERERLAIGGDLGASEDALDALERALFVAGRAASPEALGAVVDAHLGEASGALIFGVKSLRSIAKVAFHALRAG